MMIFTSRRFAYLWIVVRIKYFIGRFSVKLVRLCQTVHIFFSTYSLLAVFEVINGHLGEWKKIVQNLLSESCLQQQSNEVFKKFDHFETFCTNSRCALILLQHFIGFFSVFWFCEQSVVQLNIKFFPHPSANRIYFLVFWTCCGTDALIFSQDIPVSLSYAKNEERWKRRFCASRQKR